MAAIVIIGAGVAGLSCAWRLQQSGHQVQVLERAAVPGGRMRSERHGQLVIDRGVQEVQRLFQLGRSKSRPQPMG